MPGRLQSVSSAHALSRIGPGAQARLIRHGCIVPHVLKHKFCSGHMLPASWTARRYNDSWPSTTSYQEILQWRLECSFPVNHRVGSVGISRVSPFGGV